MKVAFISDIHSNLYALKSVLNKLKEEKVDKIYNLGDILGYHSFPNEVIELLKENRVESILGNHDFDIINNKYKKDEKDIKFWTVTNLKKENLDYVKSLPEYKVIDIENYEIRLVHGSTESITEYIFADSETAKREIDNLQEDILICAHTHFPYIKKINNKTIINTGSVGKPKIGKPHPSYILMDSEADSLFRIGYTEYEHEEAADDMINKGLSEKHAEELRTGSIIK